MGKHIFIQVNINAAQLFSALSHETRLRCLLLIQNHPELCVCELTAVTGAPQPNISRHLALLRRLGLVLDRRDGHWIHYRLNPTLPSWVQQVLRTTADAVTAAAPFAGDRQTLAALRADGELPPCERAGDRRMRG